MRAIIRDLTGPLSARKNVARLTGLRRGESALYEKSRIPRVVEATIGGRVCRHEQEHALCVGGENGFGAVSGHEKTSTPQAPRFDASMDRPSGGRSANNRGANPGIAKAALAVLFLCGLFVSLGRSSEFDEPLLGDIVSEREIRLVFDPKRVSALDGELHGKMPFARTNIFNITGGQDEAQNCAWGVGRRSCLNGGVKSLFKPVTPRDAFAALSQNQKVELRNDVVGDKSPFARIANSEGDSSAPLSLRRRQQVDLAHVNEGLFGFEKSLASDDGAKTRSVGGNLGDLPHLFAGAPKGEREDGNNQSRDSGQNFAVGRQENRSEINKGTGHYVTGTIILVCVLWFAAFVANLIWQDRKIVVREQKKGGGQCRD
jgi:hypothetical protein